MKKIYKIFPWIPIIGFFLTIWLHHKKKNDLGVDNPITGLMTLIIQFSSFIYLIGEFILS